MLPFVQSALNQQPLDGLGGIEPIIAFTGLPASAPLPGLIQTEPPIEAEIDWIHSSCVEYLSELTESLEKMHKFVSTAGEKRRAKARDRRARQRNVKLANFA
ncbi:unnamed protein product [Aphanomyces euteiches]